MRKKVLVCGGTGFIGRNIVEYFSQKLEYEVTATHFRRSPYLNKNVRWIYADLRDAKQVEEVLKGQDVVIQMAATTSGAGDILNRPHIHVTDNAVMNSLIFRAAHELKISHVLFPSCTVMYPSSLYSLKETDFNANEPIYSKYFGVGWTKVYCEKMAEFYANLKMTQYTVFRQSNIYGPHDKFDLERSHVFGATVTKVMDAKDKISVWGEGREKRDLLFVDDLVKLYDLAIKNQQSAFELVNAGLGEAISIRYLVEKIIRHSGKRIQIEYDRAKPSLNTQVCLDISKAKELFDWSPSTSLDAGIDKTLRWYQDNRMHNALYALKDKRSEKRRFSW